MIINITCMRDVDGWWSERSYHDDFNYARHVARCSDHGWCIVRHADGVVIAQSK